MHGSNAAQRSESFVCNDDGSTACPSSCTVKSEPLDGDELTLAKPVKLRTMKQQKLTEICRVKKKRDRFNGQTEEQVMAKTLPDHLDPDLDIVIIGINPGLTAAHVGHHYAGPGNHFWKCLHLSGLTPQQMNAYDDWKLKDLGIGFTNIVERTSRSSADLTRMEIKLGAETLTEKIRKYRPKIAVFNGKGIYEVFCGHKNFFIGKQPDPFPGTDTVVFVMPSSSARCSQLPRAVDKLPFYVALHKLRDHIRGDLPQLDLADVTFPDLELKVEPKKEKVDQVELKPASDGQFIVKVVPTAGDDPVGSTGESSRTRRTKRTSAGVECGQNPVVVNSVEYSVPGVAAVSPYFLQHQMQLISHPALGSGTCPWSSGSTDSMKAEVPVDYSMYGCMAADVACRGILPPFPDVKHS